MRWAVTLLVVIVAACSSDGEDGSAATGGAGGGGGASGAGGAASAAAGAGGAATGGASGTGGSDAAAGSGGSVAGFALGSEYAAYGLAAPYAAAGVAWTKLQPEIVMWQRIEPKAPVAGVHTYEWSCVDALIVEHQKAGQKQIQAYVSPKSYWASQDCPNDLACKDIAPKASAAQDFRAFVSSVIERYDGDGVSDAPGLIAPIREWVFGGEWTGFWPKDDADGYLAALGVFREEALKADPNARIGLIPFMLYDVFIGNPPVDADVQKKLADPPPAYRNSTSGMLKMLDHPELFDAVDVHSLGDYTEIPPLVAWFEKQMSSRGYTRPIFIDDAFPIGMLANGAGWPASFGVSDKTMTYQTLLEVADPAGAGYSTALAWVRAEVGRGLVKKAVVSAAAGASGIMLGNTEDWMHDTQVEGLGGRKSTIFLAGAAPMMGLIDVTHPNGLDVCKARTPGAPRPGIRNLELVASAFAGATKIEKLSGLPASVWAYRIERPTKPIFVAWNEDGILELPGQTEATVSVDLPLPGVASAKLTPAVTALSAPAPTSTSKPVTAGKLALTLGSTPVFVEPE